MMGFWDAVQTICTLLQTDNHTNTSSLNFYRLDALPDAQPTVSKHRKYFIADIQHSAFTIQMMHGSEWRLKYDEPEV